MNSIPFIVLKLYTNFDLFHILYLAKNALLKCNKFGKTGH